MNDLRKYRVELTKQHTEWAGKGPFVIEADCVMFTESMVAFYRSVVLGPKKAYQALVLAVPIATVITIEEVGVQTWLPIAQGVKVDP